MASYSAIADVGTSLVTLLRDELEELVGEEEVALASPGEIESGSNVRLTLYLYRVTENGHLNNDVRREIGDDRVKRPSLALDLYYLLTAHPSTTSNGDPTASISAQHTVLGRAMQVLHDNSVLRESRLLGGLGDDEELRISMNPEATDELLNVWSTFQDRPFRPSISYLVTPVSIDSAEEIPVQRVQERTLRTHPLKPTKDERIRD